MRRGPFGQRQQRVRQGRSGEAASSWRRIIERSPAIRSRDRSRSGGGSAGLPRRLLDHLPLRG
jgi:hypothetical protein